MFSDLTNSGNGSGLTQLWLWTCEVTHLLGEREAAGRRPAGSVLPRLKLFFVDGNFKSSSGFSTGFCSPFQDPFVRES